jgi:formiminotetrahydrofolate cyclodeaminase
MSDSIWTVTLATLRGRVAGTEPVPAGVSAAAITAVFALGLVTKVLEIASQRKDFAGDRQLVDTLLDDARGMSALLSRLADDDIAAFHQYLDYRRRKQPMDAAIRRAIEVPLNVARAAASGIALCEKAAGLVHSFVAADLGAATALLAGAVRATLFSIEANLKQLPADDAYGMEAASEARRLAETFTRLSPPFRADR